MTNTQDKQIKTFLKYIYTTLHGAYCQDVVKMGNAFKHEGIAVESTTANGISVIILTSKKVDVRSSKKNRDKMYEADISIKLAMNDTPTSDDVLQCILDNRFKELFLVGVKVSPTEKVSKAPFIDASGSDVIDVVAELTRISYA